MRLIDADALVSALNNGRLKEQTGRAVPFNAGVAFALTMVEYAPTIEPKRGEWIDAVPVVRCKDCTYYCPLDDSRPSNCLMSGYLCVRKDDFCSCGKGRR